MSDGGTSTSEIHGYDCEFDPEVDRKYHCPICLAVLRDTVQTLCGHRFCEKCLEGVIRYRPQAKCPVDNTWFKVHGEMFPDNATRREVLSLTVLCDHTLGIKRCHWKGELRHLQDHVTSCPVAPITCEYDCGTTVTRGEMTSHKTICRRRPVHCDHCDQTLPWADKTKHHLLECERFPVTCKLCGGVGIIRKNITDHLDQECPFVVVKCLFNELGCKAQEKRQNIEKHNKEHWQIHMALIAGQMVKIDTVMRTGLKKMEELSEQVVEQEVVMGVQRIELLTLRRFIANETESEFDPATDVTTNAHDSNNSG